MYLRPAPSASHGNSLAMQILRLTEFKTLGVGQAIICLFLTSLPDGSDAC